MSTKRTYQPSKRRRQKKHGFFSRLKSQTGLRVLKRRRLKKRTKLSV